MNASCHLNPNKGIWAGQQALSRGLYTNVTESSCFSVCADKFFKVLGMSVIVPSSTLPPLFPILCLLLFHEESHNEKSRRMRSIFCNVHFSSFLSPECSAVGQHVGDFIVEENKAELRHWTTFDGDSLLLPSFHLFTFLILPSFPPLIHCHCVLSFFSFSFDVLTLPVGFLQWLIRQQKQKGNKVRKCQHRICFLDAAS